MFYNSILPVMAIAAKALGPGRGHVVVFHKRQSCRPTAELAFASLPPLCRSLLIIERDDQHYTSMLLSPCACAIEPHVRVNVSCRLSASIHHRPAIASDFPRPALHGCRTSSHRICSPQLSADAAARSRDARPHLLPSHQHFCDDDDDPSILRSSVPGILRFSGNLSIFSTRSSSVAARA